MTGTNPAERMVELFSGSGNMAAAFKAQGFRTVTVDIDRPADIRKDVRVVHPEEIIEHLGGRPTVLWASPVCAGFSVAVASRNWTDRYPTSEKAYQGIELLSHTFRLIMQLKPKRWYIENPRGMMRTLPIIEFLPRRTFTFCQYGDSAQKPTDVFTNDRFFYPKACKAGDPCHDPQGTQGKANAYERGKLPPAFCDEVASR